ncbi:CRISPR-associated protein Cas4 [Candidatus Sordicultor fermentans]|jgi:CRISPR-associated exonuclease Cas4|uniref:CRISPR-associated protein Cas4 n=1 Tax=Candidatus Sordicultor fermentans TaxID=1953203 RepID=UPI0016B5F98F|nr:CRISPR-associated protein Cas4 [Atribacterota bacterium]NLY06449.1 CRISPR-associated protein Cas4 [Candidatus Atribacteria bacterium]MDI9607557.1 CRISPR-associated protein Cas4 [Atribacterota bacterium]MDY0135310.1 CRISPR-associated protein Cas4 [Atribacterota bacterium]HOA99703.1 CRISPR-associated protein Cas4 [Candidatus Atribacteria bacterium]
MVEDISGTLVQSYSICKRQSWLMAHQVTPDQDYYYLEMGRFLDTESYDRDKKKIHFENVVLDLIRTRQGNLVVGEIKKSSRAEESARLQLLFYLYRLRERGVYSKGVLLFPKERKKIEVDLTPELEKEIKSILEDIREVIALPSAPPPQKIKYCTHCAYREFCWS